jgi:hypothetical protein
MSQGYTVYIKSTQLNEEHRVFDLASMEPMQDPMLAQNWANAQAQLANTQQKNGQADWVGIVKYEQVGIETIPGYIQP